MIQVFQFNTILGSMIAASSMEGICMLEFSEIKDRDTVLKKYAAIFQDHAEYSENDIIESTIKELGEFFAGARKSFTIKIALFGTDFQKTVWQELLKIPYGTTCTYKELAVSIKRPDSIRAVANANRANKISVVIPCHRVIGSDGTLTGYNGGLERKRWLIDHESKSSGKTYSPPLF